MRCRSMLYGPASRLDFVAKFVASGTDIGVLDLEDATPLSHKDDARAVISDGRPGADDLGEMALFVRVNGLALDCLDADCEAAAAAAAHGIIAPKMESADDISVVRAAMDRAGLTNARLCAGIESALGVHRAAEIASAAVDLVYFGAEDYITDLGGRRSDSNAEVAMARGHVALAARLGEVAALDQVVVDLHDDARFVREATEARNLGYQGKMCIHPAQVPLAIAAFTPTEAEVAWAQGVLAAAEQAAAEGVGVFAYEGEMIDAPIIGRAEQILSI